MKLQEVDKTKVTPMMRQYMELKEQNQDLILFFRLGDFYEMFFEDAELVSRELELTLTGKCWFRRENSNVWDSPSCSQFIY